MRQRRTQQAMTPPRSQETGLSATTTDAQLKKIYSAMDCACAEFWVSFLHREQAHVTSLISPPLLGEMQILHFGVCSASGKCFMEILFQGIL